MKMLSGTTSAGVRGVLFSTPPQAVGIVVKLSIRSIEALKSLVSLHGNVSLNTKGKRRRGET
jgi:hypothetical protein